MRDVLDLLDSIQRDIFSKYPKGVEKVSPSFANHIFSITDREITQTGDRDAYHQFKLLVDKTYSKSGIKSADFFRELEKILITSSGRILRPRTDITIERLERQLRDLKSIVSTPQDFDERFRELQEQLTTIREDIAGGRSSLMSNKQEDMLQKFITSEKKAFIIMPFQRDFDNVWLGGIKPACIECHYAPLRVDEVNLSSLITDDIEKYSTMASVVIVDLTDNNPNVMFELGWALAKNKKPIVICQGEHASKVAFDVRSIRYIPYENSWLGIETLKQKIKDYITTTEKQQPQKSSKRKVKKKSTKKPAVETQPQNTK